MLLGLPDGENELLEGQVRRQLPHRTASEARGSFKRLARQLCELCELCSVSWRRRFIKGSSRFEMEGMVLEQQGSLVQLTVPVPGEIRRAFRNP